jgi:hypothetical protein
VVPVPVSGLGGGFGWAVDAICGKCKWERRDESLGMVAYRTVRAWSSTGAPERTAAATTSPSSLPFMTRFGIGVNSLARG